MKVICIKDCTKKQDPMFIGLPIEVGEEVSVIGRQYCTHCKQNELQFAEKEDAWYPEDHFSPVSDIDETEMERNYDKRKVEEPAYN